MRPCPAGPRGALRPRSPLTLPCRPPSLRRIRDKYETELSELEQSERKLQERCAELKGRLGEAEGENLRLQGLVRRKEKELAEVAAVSAAGGAWGAGGAAPARAGPRSAPPPCWPR